MIRNIMMAAAVLALFSCGADGKPETNTPGAEKAYEIDGRQVTGEEFRKFVSDLKEVPGTWYCEETTDGGTTGYDMKDGRGRVYEFTSVSESGKSRSSIRRKALLE